MVIYELSLFKVPHFMYHESLITILCRRKHEVRIWAHGFFTNMPIEGWGYLQWHGG